MEHLNLITSFHNLIVNIYNNIFNILLRRIERNFFLVQNWKNLHAFEVALIGSPTIEKTRRGGVN